MNRKDEAPKEAFADTVLDFLRDLSIPYWLETILSAGVALGCGLYYGIAYLETLFYSSPGERIPLVIASNTNTQGPPNDAKILCREIEEALIRSSTASETVDMVAAIRTSLPLRQKVQHFMDATGSEAFPLYHNLEAIWNDLVLFPSFSSSGGFISVVIPAYHERGENLASCLQTAFEASARPLSVEIIVVNAGGCENLDDCLRFETGRWKNFVIASYTGEGGRGPCLNFGASKANGDVLTFLHSDTRLPSNWDVNVVKEFLEPHPDKFLTQASAFRFGHCTENFAPAGIRMVAILGNLRASLFHLPYGDHVISIPAPFFNYLGGYPEQPIMEDYELMKLLRKRAALLKTERIRIIGGPPARCSVRRWKRFGVAYVTLVNALLVYRYNHGWTAEDIFNYYYNRPLQRKTKQL